MDKYIDADELIKYANEEITAVYAYPEGKKVGDEQDYRGKWEFLSVVLKAAPAVEVPRWIPVTERVPETIEPVNITWVNHKPEWYYEHIKDEPFVATGHYCNGRWYWFSAVCQDYLNEYGDCEMDRIDSAVEVIAWMPLPTPYKGGEEE